MDLCDTEWVNIYTVLINTFPLRHITFYTKYIYDAVLYTFLWNEWTLYNSIFCSHHLIVQLAILILTVFRVKKMMNICCLVFFFLAVINTVWD